MYHNSEEGRFDKFIQVQENPHFLHDYKQQTAHLEEMTSFLKGEKKFDQPEDAPLTCHTHKTGPSAKAQFEFLPVWTGKLMP